MADIVRSALDWLLGAVDWLLEKAFSIFGGIFDFFFDFFFDCVSDFKESISTLADSLISSLFDVTDLPSFMGSIVFLFIGLLLFIFIFKHVVSAILSFVSGLL